MTKLASTLERAREEARAIAQRDDLDRRLEPYSAHRPGGQAPNSSLLLDDVSAIPFLSAIPGVELYQHRARVRAGDGDIFAAVTPPFSEYESYCQKRLHLGTPTCLLAEPVKDDLLGVARACQEGQAFDAIVAHARRAGALRIHPYMGIESVWVLARLVAAESGADVEVMGPPPPITWIANDKAAFGEVVERVLGEAFLVDTLVAKTPAAIADNLADLARKYDVVGLKRTRCASAMGNRVFDGRALRPAEPEDLLADVERFLQDTEWTHGEQVLAVEWVKTDCSPSTQLWIPAHGPVQVEGVYEQLLEGETKVFLGSRPSTLPGPVNAALSEASLAVGTALQTLGYVGRCSFDFLIVGDLDAEFQVKFTECNGRWGGTSTPMHLVDRLLEVRPHYRAQDVMFESLVGVNFSEIESALSDVLFDAETKRGTFILYNVGPLTGSGKFDVIAFGGTPAECDDAMLSVLPQKLGV